MPAIPLPFVITLLLLLLTVILYQRHEPGLKPAIFFLLLCTAMVTIVGLRWTEHFLLIRWLQPVAAACVPPAAWYCFTLTRQDRISLWWHAISPVLVLLLVVTHLFWSPLLDLMLLGIYLGYGMALIWVALRDASELHRVRITDLQQTRKAMLLAGVILLFSALTDVLVGLDLAMFHGLHNMEVISIAHLILIPLLSLAVIIVSQGVTTDTGTDLDTASALPTDNDCSRHENHEIAATVAQLIQEQQLFLDPDLTINRLARKAGIPARQISAAINNIHGRNISQWINEFRIGRAKELLTSSDDSITQIYLASGFQTKSNFNREFSRITGMTPSVYRRSVSTSDIT